MLNSELLLSIIYKEEKESLLFNQLVHFYKTHVQSFISTMGYGVLINGKDDLTPQIEKSSSNSKVISFTRGAFIDKRGRIVIVPKTLTKSFNVKEFYGEDIYFYIRSIEVKNKKNEHPGGFVIQDTLLKGEIFLSKEKKPSNSEYIELCRISIDGDDISLSHPKNPFNPKKNELDIRFVPRLLSNYSLSPDINLEIHTYFVDYASFFSELATKIKMETTTLVASVAYQSAMQVTLNTLSTFEIYTLLFQLVKITGLFYREVENRIENIKNSDFRRSLSRLESMFFAEESLNEGMVEFYKLELGTQEDTKNFWENIFAHFHDISFSQDDWKMIVKQEEIIPVKKAYLIVGRLGGENLDIEIDYPYISSNHLKITKNDMNSELLDIEDLGSANGTYFQGIRYEKHKKVTIHKQATIKLYDYEFDIYNNSIVQKFLANLI